MNSPQHRSLLTKREREIFQLLILDYSTKDISQKLGISEKTVRNHISNVMCFEVHNFWNKIGTGSYV